MTSYPVLSWFVNALSNCVYNGLLFVLLVFLVVSSLFFTYYSTCHGNIFNIAGGRELGQSASVLDYIKHKQHLEGDVVYCYNPEYQFEKMTERNVCILM